MRWKEKIKSNKNLYHICISLYHSVRCIISQQERAFIRYKRDGGERLRYQYSLNEQSVVFDAGGYKGTWSKNIYDKYGCSIYVFEPIEEYAEKIKKQLLKTSEDMKKIHVFSVGLDCTTHECKISLEEDASSQYETEKRVGGGEW